MAILNNSNAISSGGYDINNSLRFRSSASAYLSRTPASAGNRTTWTWSGWVKRGTLSSTQFLFSAGTGNTVRSYIGINSSNNLTFGSENTSVVADLTTTQVLRDPSAWYHIIVAVDTTQATASNRVKLYLNGSQITAFGTTTYPALNTDLVGINTTNAHTIGVRGTWFLDSYLDGYMAEVNFIDGQALTPSSFGETDTDTGSWKPKAYTGTYGTNGFYLKFSDIATTSGSNAGLGKDFSGNTNYWTTNNISVTAGTTYDAMTDSPTLTSATVANYAVLSPIDQAGGPPSGGNLDLTIASGTSNCVPGTIAVSSGKWYWEVTIGSTTNANWMVGIADSSGTIASRAWTGANGWYYFTNGNKYNNNTGTAYGSSYTTGDIIGVALDMDAGTLVFYKNNVSQGTAYSSLTGKTMQAALGNGTGGGTQTYNINFGQRPFSYTPPTGYVRLNTFNLPDSTIVKGNTVMDATLYTGTGSARSVVNAAGFKPDFVWMKERSSTSSHQLFDVVRGATKNLESNSTSAEGTFAQTLTSFNANGFSLGTDSAVNENTITYVGWQWQAGQGSTSSNTAGSITSTVSVNATAGFSVVTYTGTGSAATVGHGLGVAPKMIIVKGRNATIEWLVYHASLGATQYITLNTTGAAASAASAWNNTAPTSSVFSVLSAGSTNFSGTNYVAYCWAEISGFSKFGSYTGNGNANGPFVYLGFRPKFIIVKNTSASGSWNTFDSSRSAYNAIGNLLNANISDAEYTQPPYMDFLSNGFKIRTNDTGQSTGNENQNGNTYIYMAFAENPFKNSLAR